MYVQNSGGVNRIVIIREAGRIPVLPGEDSTCNPWDGMKGVCRIVIHWT